MLTPFIGGNWKMNTDRASAARLARDVAAALPEGNVADVAVFPPFPYLIPVSEVVASPEGSARMMLGAQDCYHEASGAFTGEVSVGMLRDVGVGAVLVGHSERRHVIGEDDALVNLKARAVLDAGLVCVLCVGETLEQRHAGQADEINAAQVRAGLRGVTGPQTRRLVVAYEPVWAIGTGASATPQDAGAAHASIRSVLGGLFGPGPASGIRVIYGGSVSAANARDMLGQPDVDGALVGGASLRAKEFAGIVAVAGEIGRARAAAGPGATARPACTQESPLPKKA
ncbi:MAG TPA: triose-phosphate isomerase [Phycisphaerales bacterium]|nr:triose-phosphate isomerase [Phycisphaerales bacterium]